MTDVHVSPTPSSSTSTHVEGFDSKLGARPLQRVIDEEIKKPLSRMILFGELQEGGMVEVGLTDDVIPKLTVEFKAKKVLTQMKTDKVKNEKTS